MGAGDSSGSSHTNHNFNFTSSQIRLLKSIKVVVFVLSDAVKYVSGTIMLFPLLLLRNCTRRVGV